MLIKARRWGVWTALLVTAALAATPTKSVGQRKSITVPGKPNFDDIADAAYCPPTVFVQLTSDRTGVSRTYWGPSRRGADAPLGKVWYTFTRLYEDNGFYVASGNWWLYGWECRLYNAQLLEAVIELTTLWRASWTEVNTLDDYASRCVDGDTSKLPDYDPYEEYDPDELDCSGQYVGGGGGSGGGTVPTGCTIEHVVIEISRDGGVTWKTWWEGDAIVC